MIFWNVAGLEKQNKDFQNYIRGFDFIELYETWVSEKK